MLKETMVDFYLEKDDGEYMNVDRAIYTHAENDTELKNVIFDALKEFADGHPKKIRLTNDGVISFCVNRENQKGAIMANASEDTTRYNYIAYVLTASVRHVGFKRINKAFRSRSKECQNAHNHAQEPESIQGI